ncbi:MAG: hypothetical protein HY791_11470 [Deltaproteobacteria bacterium]|nr:hypothetical protein [Deltaproteobacteria bacterium]
MSGSRWSTLSVFDWSSAAGSRTRATGELAAQARLRVRISDSIAATPVRGLKRRRRASATLSRARAAKECRCLSAACYLAARKMPAVRSVRAVYHPTKVRHTFSLLLAACSVACSAGSRVPLEPPEGASWWVGLALDGDRIVESSGLVPTEEPVRLPEEDGLSLHILAYSFAQLEAMLGADADFLVAGAPIALAHGCDPRLDEPFWHVFGDKERLVPATESLELTAPWLFERCPKRADGNRASARVTCAWERCPASFDAPSCELTLHLDECALGAELKARLDWRGELCFEPTSECAQTPTRFEAMGSATCAFERDDTPCIIDAYVNPAPIELSFERVAVLDVPPRAPASVDDGPVDPMALRGGYLMDVLPLSDSVVVSARGDRLSDRFSDSHSCEASEPTTLLFVDPSDLSIATATAPPCLERMAPSPRGGFFGAYRRGKAQFVGELDARRRLSREVELGVSVDSRPWVGAFEAIAEGTQLALILNDYSSETGEDRAQLQILDALTLAPVASSSFVSVVENAALTSLVETATGLVVSDSSRAHLLWLRPSEEPRTTQFCLFPSIMNQKTSFVADAGQDAGQDRLVVGMTATLPQTIRFVGDQISNCRNLYEDTADPTAGIGWDRESFLVALRARDDDVGNLVLAMFDPSVASPRYYPGSIDLGPGPASRLVGDRGGVIWGLLPWTGELLRIERR